MLRREPLFLVPRISMSSFSPLARHPPTTRQPRHYWHFDPLVLSQSMVFRAVRRLLRRGAGVWEASQVELHGQYSIAHLQELARYHESASWFRVLVVCILTPVPCIACVVLIDLVRLEPISAGALGSPKLWLRTFLSTFAMTMSTLEHFRRHIEGMALSLGAMLGLAFVVSAVAVGLTILLAILIGFPIPFGLILGTLPWFATLMSSLAFVKWKQLRQSRRLALSTLRYMVVCCCQITITLIYPLYNFVFARLSSSQQTGFVFLLPIIKIIIKNWIARALNEQDDGRPEAVVFNIEIFHALYVAFCMGSATSVRTVFALMSVDLAQAWLSFYDIHVLLADLKPIATKLDRARQRAATTRTALLGLLEISCRIITVEPHLEIERAPHRRRYFPRRILNSVSTGLRRLLAARRVTNPPDQAPLPGPQIPAVEKQFTTGLIQQSLASAASILPYPFLHRGPQESHVPPSPPPTTLPSDLAILNAVERGILVRGTLQLLYITEFVVLVEYVEVIMPVVYNVLVVTFLKLPNHVFYPFLKGLELRDLIPTLENVLLYASLEFVSLAVFTAVLWWKLRLSLLHQLAFVLENRQTSVQAKLVVWVIYVMQCSIDHFGADYTFRFEWLRHK